MKCAIVASRRLPGPRHRAKVTLEHSVSVSAEAAETLVKLASSEHYIPEHGATTSAFLHGRHFVLSYQLRLTFRLRMHIDEYSIDRLVAMPNQCKLTLVFRIVDRPRNDLR